MSEYENDDVMMDDEGSEEDESSEYDSDEDSATEEHHDDIPMGSVPTGGNQHALLASFLAQMPPAEAAEETHVDAEIMQAEQQASPEVAWQNHLSDVAESTSKSLKVTDAALKWYFHVMQQLENNEPVSVELEFDIDTDGLFLQIKDAIQSNSGLTHVIWGTKAWQLFGLGQQQDLLRCLTTRHAPHLCYWKMGTENAGPLGGSAMSAALLHALVGTEWNLTELEVAGLVLETPKHLEWFSTFLRQTPTLRQVNLLDFYLDSRLCVASSLDPFLTSAAEMPTLDELRLCRATANDTDNFVPPLISPEAWQHLLTQKPKWWRLAMDGLGLDDRHAHVLADALRASPQCKMGDLLSLQRNPHLTDFDTLMRVCFCKQRMGEVSIDDRRWVETFHLVRSMNNLHRRLEYVLPETGGYPSRDRWIEWLAVLGNIGWQDEAHRVNYLWFSLLEQPNFVKLQPTSTTGRSGTTS